MTDLELFIQSHRRRPISATDWSKRKEKWLNELGMLLSGIQEKLVSAGVPSADIHSTENSLNEEYLGQYDAPGLVIHIGGNEVVFKPKGSRVMGAFGRVDVLGPRGRARLIADVEEGDSSDEPLDREWQWYVYPEHGRKGHFLFDEDSLVPLLEIVLG
ncbi:MAG: hypothetical protein KFB96_06545 [Thiocapsa sp.]|uniref:hypothetical protein n=1 Tax=Thiocapsa sp. TaxID=2024551 RepID=UPI001BD0DAD5|nr:hypothetical protein [Thiocapsa sp.]QVL50118.1 MAG: hypothetical protein KFB96_06545 [Thiocapsa sp.]